MKETPEWDQPDRTDAIEAIRLALEDVAAGRVRPLADFIAEQRTRHNLPELPADWQRAAELL
jgi:hypothetical protein